MTAGLAGRELTTLREDAGPEDAYSDKPRAVSLRLPVAASSLKGASCPP